MFPRARALAPVSSEKEEAFNCQPHVRLFLPHHCMSRFRDGGPGTTSSVAGGLGGCFSHPQRLRLGKYFPASTQILRAVL